jgi:hypothetical protein
VVILIYNNNRGPVYSKHQTDFNSLKNELEFTWETLLKKLKKKEQMEK